MTTRIPASTLHPLLPGDWTTVLDHRYDHFMAILHVAWTVPPVVACSMRKVR